MVKFSNSWSNSLGIFKDTFKRIDTSSLKLAQSVAWFSNEGGVCLLIILLFKVSITAEWSKLRSKFSSMLWSLMIFFEIWRRPVCKSACWVKWHCCSLISNLSPFSLVVQILEPQSVCFIFKSPPMINLWKWNSIFPIFLKNGYTTSRNVIVNTFSKIEIWQHFYYFFLLSFFILLTVFQNANSITLSSMLLAYKIIIAIKELSFVKKINKFLVADRILCIWSILTNNNIFNVFKRFYIVKYHRQIY